MDGSSIPASCEESREFPLEDVEYLYSMVDTTRIRIAHSLSFVFIQHH